MKLIYAPEAAELLGTTPEMLSGYHLLGVVNNQVCAVGRLLYHWSIYVDLDASGYSRRYCYTDDGNLVLIAFTLWRDGEPEPRGWSKDVRAGIYQDPATGKRWSENEPEPRSL